MTFAIIRSARETTDIFQAMKSSIVETIKLNQDLAYKLEEMDIKIALLVQNRMSIEAIIAENRKLQNNHFGGSDSRGIKAFSKDAKRLLDGYQQLFYLLQTDPGKIKTFHVKLKKNNFYFNLHGLFSLFDKIDSSSAFKIKSRHSELCIIAF